MGLTDITKEEERKVEKNEKKMITILGAVIAVIVVILAVMLIMGRDTSTADNSGTSLKEAVQEETDSKKSNEGEDVSDGDVGQADKEQPDDNTAQTTTEDNTTTEASDDDDTQSAR